MSNTLDLYPDGFASGSGGHDATHLHALAVQSVDGGKTFQSSSVPFGFESDYAVYNDSTGIWAHDFGVSGVFRVTDPSNTSIFLNSTLSFRFRNGILVWEDGPGVTFTGLPFPVCSKAPNNWFATHACGHAVLADGTHLHTASVNRCDSKVSSLNLVAFRSADGYNYEYAGFMANTSQIPHSSEGPNEHDITLLPNGEILCVMRTGAGDGSRGYLPFYKTLSKDGGRTWSTPEIMPTMGCARPHLLQVGSATLLSGGRRMLPHSYDRGIDIWMSQDGGNTWDFASATYHHNAKAKIAGVPLWPSSVNATGWRFEFTSGYPGLVRVGETSAMLLYDFMPPVANLSDHSQSGLLEESKLFHNPPYSFAMRIDLVPKARIAVAFV